MQKLEVEEGCNFCVVQFWLFSPSSIIRWTFHFSNCLVFCAGEIATCKYTSNFSQCFTKAERWSAHVCENVEILGASDSRLHHSFWCFSQPRYVCGHTQHTRKFNVLNFCSTTSGRNKGPFVWFFCLDASRACARESCCFFPSQGTHKESKCESCFVVLLRK